MICCAKGSSSISRIEQELESSSIIGRKTPFADNAEVLLHFVRHLFYTNVNGEFIKFPIVLDAPGFATTSY
jgi:hypothetical protein